MNEIFNGVSVAGIIQPGQAYIFYDSSDRGWSPEAIECMYVIREEKEILPALDMEFCIIMAEEYKMRRFVGIRKVNKNCHEFKVACYDKHSEKEIKRALYLHRIQSFQESLSAMKKLFGVPEDKQVKRTGK